MISSISAGIPANEVRSPETANAVVFFGLGSMLAIDVEESCARLGINVIAGIKNLDGPIYVTNSVHVIAPAEIDDRVRTSAFLLPMFAPGNRLRARLEAEKMGFSRLTRIVDPTAVVATSAQLGAGVYVNAGAVVGGGVLIGECVTINRAASIGHHSELADYCSIGPGATIAGAVRIGRGTVVAAGAVILPQIEIGANSVIAAGAVVSHHVPANSLVAGNPARIVRSGIRGYRRLPV